MECRAFPCADRAFRHHDAIPGQTRPDRRGHTAARRGLTPPPLPGYAPHETERPDSHVDSATSHDPSGAPTPCAPCTDPTPIAASLSNRLTGRPLGGSVPMLALSEPPTLVVHHRS